jgi:dihydrofolate reductase
MTTSVIELVVAVADYGAIGYKNNLVWTNKKDLARFKQLTSGHPVIMGRNTWESLPKKPLPNRYNVVVSTKLDQTSVPAGVKVVSSFQEALDLFSDDEKVFVIGGARLYEEAEKICSKIHLTRVYGGFRADTYMPEIDYEKYEVKEVDSLLDENNIPAIFYEYTRK